MKRLLLSTVLVVALGNGCTLDEHAETAPPSCEIELLTFRDTCRYDDGLEVRVASVKVAKPTSRDVRHTSLTPGTDYAVFTIESKNLSTHDLDERAAAAATYGSSEETADEIVHLSDHQRLSGTIHAGQSVRGRFAFAIPAASHGDVTLELLSINADRESAVFSGPLHE